MGSNIHVTSEDGVPLKELPEGLSDCFTIFRFTDSWKFMSFLCKNGISQPNCSCINEDKGFSDHVYFCDYSSRWRPKDFEDLRRKTKTLQPWTQELIDYLESEPNAWLEYD